MDSMTGKKNKKRNPGQKKALFLLSALILLAVLIPAAVMVCTMEGEKKQYQYLTRRLEKLGEFTTVTQRYRSVFYMREKKNLIQDKSVLFTAEFNVLAGVDLAEGFDLAVKGRQVRISLPPGRIFLVDADDASIEEIMVRQQFSSIHTGDYLPLISEEKDRIRKQVLAGDVPRQAEERAALLIRGILRAAGIEEADIRFRSEVPGGAGIPEEGDTP